MLSGDAEAIPEKPVHRPLACALLLLALSGCGDGFQPKQITRHQATTGLPPLTGTLPNGVIGNSETK